jgi:crossover junction endodeoxyribonuclease RusA
MRLPPDQEAAVLATGAKVTGVNAAALFPDEGFEPVRLYLPFPPSLNRYWRHVTIKGSVRVLLSREGRLYRKAVEAAVWEARVKPIGGRLAVTLLVRCPDRKVRDLDNLCKAVLDALAHAGVYADDGQIDQLTIRRMLPKAGGELLCRIEPYMEAV